MPAELHIVQTCRDECRDSAIARLEECLVEAKAGKVVAVSIAVVRPDGAINTSRSFCDDVGRLLGAMTLAVHRMSKSIDD